MYSYGVSYAVASLSCSIGPFLAVTGAGLRAGSVVTGVSVYLAYTAGLAMVVGVLAIAAAMASLATANRLRRILPFVNRISGALLLLIGLYVAYYARYELRLLTMNANPRDAVIAAAGRLQGMLAGWVHQHGIWPWAAALLGLAVLVAGSAWRRRARRQSARTGGGYLIQPRRRPHRSRTRKNSTATAKPIKNKFSIWPTWFPRSIASRNMTEKTPTPCQLR
jgi:hypothetical protein